MNNIVNSLSDNILQKSYNALKSTLFKSMVLNLGGVPL